MNLGEIFKEVPATAGFIPTHVQDAIELRPELKEELSASNSEESEESESELPLLRAAGFLLLPEEWLPELPELSELSDPLLLSLSSFLGFLL